MRDDEVRRLREMVEAAARGELRIDYGTPLHPVLAALHLQIAQTYLLEMMKSEPPEKRPADTAYQLVARAVLILSNELPTDEQQ
jgi:hypothetical protein